MKCLNLGSIIAVLFIAGLLLQSSSTKKNIKHLKPPQEYLEGRNYPYLGEGQESYHFAVAKALKLNKKTRSTTTPWQIEGPYNIGGRITCVAIDKTSPQTMYIGTPAGGIYKTTNAGTSWTHLFKNEVTLSIGSLAIDPNNNQVIYAGTGDNAMSSFTYLGRGIYKSTNGGATWSNIGLENTGVITKILINPLNTQEMYATAMGNIYSLNSNKGLYKSIDGGTTWTNVLFLSNQCGVMDLVMDLSHPDTLFATGMHRYRTSQSSVTYGQKTKIYRSYNGGATWDTMSNGLPVEPNCRINLAMSQNNPNLIYASYCDTTLNYGGLYKTTNSGNTWSFVSQDPDLEMGGFGWYFGGIRLDPNNDNILYWMGIDLYKSTNGGATWSLNASPWYNYDVHADKHDLQFINSNEAVLATDGGLYKTTTGGGQNTNSWTYISQLPITQFYEVGYNPFDTASYYGGAQDNGTETGSALGGLSNWVRYFGGDGFQPAFDSLDPAIMYAETQNGNIYVTTSGGSNWDPLTSSFSSIERCNWNMPYLLSKHNYQYLYTGSYRVLMNTTGVLDSWSPISPDLTDGTNNIHHTISTLDESKLVPNLLYAGTSDARIWVTQNGGSSWTQINSGMPQRNVSSIKASPNHSNAVFVGYWGYRDNDTNAYIYYSSNYGATWTNIASASLPNFAINDIWIKPDGTDSSLLVANDGGVYATQNRGLTWVRVGNNMPIIPVYDIEYNPKLKKIFVGTFAMSIQSMPIDSIFPSQPVINPTSTTALELDEKIVLYPNPASESISFSSSSSNKHYDIEIRNTLGQLISSHHQQAPSSQINVSTLHSGVYYLVIRDGKSSMTKPFVKK
jgi:photosystem II stability/assembly factor-like uncharacterized protein